MQRSSGQLSVYDCVNWISAVQVCLVAQGTGFVTRGQHHRPMALQPPLLTHMYVASLCKPAGFGNRLHFPAEFCSVVNLFFITSHHIFF